MHAHRHPRHAHTSHTHFVCTPCYEYYSFTNTCLVHLRKHTHSHKHTCTQTHQHACTHTHAPLVHALLFPAGGELGSGTVSQAPGLQDKADGSPRKHRQLSAAARILGSAGLGVSVGRVCTRYACLHLVSMMAATSYTHTCTHACTYMHTCVGEENGVGGGWSRPNSGASTVVR